MAATSQSIKLDIQHEDPSIIHTNFQRKGAAPRTQFGQFSRWNMFWYNAVDACVYSRNGLRWVLSKYWFSTKSNTKLQILLGICCTIFRHNVRDKYWSAKRKKSWLRRGVIQVSHYCFFLLHKQWEISFGLTFIFSYLAVVVKRAVNILYHFNFIYTKTKLYKQDRKYLEAADSLPKQVRFFSLSNFFRLLHA